MKGSTSLNRQMVFALFMSAVLSVALPAWSDSGKKPFVKGAVERDASIGNDDKSRRDRKDSKNEVKDRSGKGEGTAKKKVIKKAGTAAAVSVAGKKVTSKLKNNNRD